MRIEKVGVIGSGLMGSGIAQVAAYNGFDVTLVDLDQERVDSAIAGIRKRLEREAERGRITAEACEDSCHRLSGATDMDSLKSMSRMEVVIEAVVEDIEVKSGVFRQLGKVCRGDALLASNTSSLPLSDLAAASGRPERVIGLHFFNPPWALKLVEIVSTASTTEETLRDAMRFCEKLGRVAVQVKDTPGFIANRLLVPLIFDAIEMLDNGGSDRRGHRQCLQGRPEPHHGAARHCRPHRAGHAKAHRGEHVRGVRRAALQSTDAAAPAREPGPPWAEDGTRVLPVRRLGGVTLR
ncbi:MAG: 3-hydroxyacyl-CoA dehydrogenase family protein [Dehalococcoidia bacterium]|nr:3-hydroxyacyl-CoA dehydrogenase family protein [Dehalococcoidia bacterium]